MDALKEILTIIGFLLAGIAVAEYSIWRGGNKIREAVKEFFGENEDEMS